MELNSRARHALLNHVEREWPREAGGVIRCGGYCALQNLHSDPERHWEFEVDDLGGVEAIVHSHPDGCEFPSRLDMESQIALGLPHGIVPAADGFAGEPFFWPDTERPYLGRPYRHGVTDCLQLVRDWLRRERGIEVPPFPYGWQERGDLFGAGIQELCWERIEPMAAVAGDVVLLGRGRATHCGVLLEDGRLLHHPGMKPYDPTCLSRREPVSRLQRLIVGVVRPS